MRSLGLVSLPVSSRCRTWWLRWISATGNVSPKSLVTGVPFLELQRVSRHLLTAALKIAPTIALALLQPAVHGLTILTKRGTKTNASLPSRRLLLSLPLKLILFQICSALMASSNLKNASSAWTTVYVFAVAKLATLSAIARALPRASLKGALQPLPQPPRLSLPALQSVREKREQPSALLTAGGLREPQR